MHSIASEVNLWELREFMSREICPLLPCLTYTYCPISSQDLALIYIPNKRQMTASSMCMHWGCCDAIHLPTTFPRNGALSFNKGRKGFLKTLLIFIFVFLLCKTWSLEISIGGILSPNRLNESLEKGTSHGSLRPMVDLVLKEKDQREETNLQDLCTVQPRLTWFETEYWSYKAAFCWRISWVPLLRSPT